MAYVTEALFRGDSYITEAEAEVVHVNERGGIILDRTIFYATSGGQPGDTGRLTAADGRTVGVAATITGETKDEIIHVPSAVAGLKPGDRVGLAIDWERRLKLMRMHTACHLLWYARFRSPARRWRRTTAASTSIFLTLASRKKT